MQTLVECVPNFSEGRDKSKVDAIIEAMKMDGVYLLDREMDADHNRCVITLAGERDAVQEAAIRGVGKASELIDLNKHQGAHPRLGAADVVPFIPIEGVSIADCVTMARDVGEQISMKPPLLPPSARTWRTYAAASSKASATILLSIPRANLISEIPACIHRLALASWVRGSS